MLSDGFFDATAVRAPAASGAGGDGDGGEPGAVVVDGPAEGGVARGGAKEEEEEDSTADGAVDDDGAALLAQRLDDEDEAALASTPHDDLWLDTAEFDRTAAINAARAAALRAPHVLHVEVR